MARGLPTAVTLAAKDEALASALVQALGSSTFRPYHTSDVRGVEIGGAAKNVLAIAAGAAGAGTAGFASWWFGLVGGRGAAPANVVNPEVLTRPGFLRKLERLGGTL